MDVLLIEAREALLQRRNSLSSRARSEAGRGSAALRYASGPLTEQEQRELVDIDAALTRMAEGDFGRCARCGGAIGRHRLRAIPEARYCATCSDVMGR
jgi:RNA polymerase-binding transcription factor DksA